MLKSFGPLFLVSEPAELPLPALIGEGTAALNGAPDCEALLHLFP